MFALPVSSLPLGWRLEEGTMDHKLSRAEVRWCRTAVACVCSVYTHPWEREYMGEEETHHLLPQLLLSLVRRHLWCKDLLVLVFHPGASALSEMRILHWSLPRKWSLIRISDRPKYPSGHGRHFSHRWCSIFESVHWFWRQITQRAVSDFLGT